MLPPKKNKGAVQASAVTTDQVHGAMAAFANHQKNMSKKAKKRVASRLKAMKAGAK